MNFRNCAYFVWYQKPPNNLDWITHDIAPNGFLSRIPSLCSISISRRFKLPLQTPVAFGTVTC